MPLRRSGTIYYGWVMVGTALAINLASATLNPVVFSFFIGPMSETLDVSKSALSFSFTLRLLVAGATGPFLGVLIDRHGARWLGALAGLMAGTTLMLLAAAPSLLFVYLVFAFSGLAGLGGPSGQLLTQVPLGKWFVRHRARAMAIATAGLGGGTVIAIPLTGWLVDSVGWRETYVIYGLVVVAVVVPVSIIWVRRAPEDMGLAVDGIATDTSVTGAHQTAVIIEEEWSARDALRTPTLWVALAALALAGLALTGTIVHRTQFFKDAGIDSSTVALGISLDPLVLLFSVFFWGFVAERVPIRIVGCLGLLGLALAAVPMVITRGESYTVLAHGAIFGLSAGAFVTVNNLLWPDYFGRASLGTIRGITLPVSIAASGIGAPLFGLLLDSDISPDLVWGITICLFGAAALLLLVTRPPQHAPGKDARTAQLRPAESG